MEERKRIAFLCQPYHRGGVTRWMADAAIAYAQNGHEVYFMTLAPLQTFFSGVGRETMLDLLSKANTGIHIIKIKVGRSFEFGTPDYCAFIYKQLLLGLPIGIPVILSDDSMVWQAATSLHSSYPLIGVLHADEDYYYNLGVKYASEADALVCVSERINRKITDRLKQSGYRSVYTIPCGINMPDLGKDNSTSTEVTKITYAGRITNYQKRVGDLVKIAKALSKKERKFHLSIIGDGGDKNSLEEKIKNENLSDNVTFCGWLSQKEVAGHLHSSDILLLTSDFEGTPVAMMEALALGCGFAGTRVSGVEDYENVPGAQNCYMVNEVGDIEAAVNNIIKLSAVPADVRKNAAREIAATHFSMQVCLERYNDVIKNIPLRTYVTPLVSLAFSQKLYSSFISFARYIKMKFFKN